MIGCWSFYTKDLVRLQSLAQTLRRYLHCATLEDVRRVVSLLLIYAMAISTMPVQARELENDSKSGTRAETQNGFSTFRDKTSNDRAGSPKPLDYSARLWPKKGLPLIASVRSHASMSEIRSSLHRVLPRIYASTVDAGTVSTIQSNFNGTAIAGGNYIWFNSVLKPSGLGSSTVKIFIRSSSIQFTAHGISYNLPVPDATITFSPAATSATTGFDTTTNQWLTTVPSNLSGNTFLTGLAFPVPTGGLPGGINPVTWQGQFYTDTSGVTLQWQWAAAVYTAFASTYGGLGVKPVDSNSASQYQNSDHAGTPELYKSYVVGGSRGGGGSNYTGSYSGTAAVSPVVGTPNLPPTANAGPNQTVYIGTNVQLDGTGSTDPDGDPLTYHWSLTSVPTGSAATLSSTTSPQPTFLVDKPGSYTAQLIVNDGFVNSTPSTVVISTKNSPPVANAGPNQTTTVTSTVQLDGSGSSDVDGDSLTYKWSFASVPTGSAATLSNPAIVNPTFVVDKKGAYTVQLIVNDGQVDSAPADVTITTLNSPPVANAGPDQKINVGQTVQLDGSGSTDVDGDTLTYAWSMLSTPAGSNATISNPTSVKPTFYADLIGTYIVQLVVNDGTVNGAAVTVKISTSDVAPVANPGPAQSVDVGSVVTLDGTGSTDSDNQPLTYQWSLSSVPVNSTAALSVPTSAKPSFTADMPGNYVVQLIVNDGYLSSSPATVIMSTINTVPVANPGNPQIVPVGNTVQLSGAASSDADHDPLTYKWAILSQPAGGTAVLANPNTVNPTFVPNVSGYYVVQLIVNDGIVDSLPVTVTITGNAPPVVDAGPNQTIALPNATATLNGSATDDGNGIPPNTLTFSWAGPAGVVFTNPNAAVTNATFSAAGTYVLQLTASDGQLSGSATTTITVNPAPNQPPIVSAGPNQTVPFPNNLPLQGSVKSGNTPPGVVASLWTQLSGPPVKFANPISPAGVAQLNVAGVYVLQLTGTENGISSSSQVTITTTSGNLPPVVSAGSDQTTTLPINTVALSGIATDDGLPAGSTLTYSWSVVSGPGTVSFANSTSPTTSASFSTQGLYTLRLTASDTQLTASSDVHVTVLPQNDPPVVNAGTDQTITLPVNVVFLTGTATDDGLPAGSVLKITWSVASGPAAVQFGNPNSTDTTALFTAAGTYDLRLTADDSQYRTSAEVIITVNPAPGGASSGSISLTPVSVSPVLVGTTQTFQAAVQNATGAPITGATVTFTVTGANPKTGTATTNASGNATFSYTGSTQGLDEVTASEGSGTASLVSNSSPVNWVASAPQVSASSITGNFFTSDGSGSFDTLASAQPVFSQTFAAVDFNPPAGTIPGAPSSIDVTTRPFTNVTTDANGNYTGSVVAQGNNLQAGVGTLSTCQSDFTGTLTVAAAGNVTFNFLNADGFVFGVGNGASRISGTFVNPPSNGVTVFKSYPVMGSFNTATAPVANTITVHFPNAGSYPFEIEYAASSQNALIAPGSLWKYSLANPTGFQQPGFDDSSFAQGFSPFTNAVGAQSPGFGCPLIGATYFPVFGTVDLRKTINLPNGASNVTAYVSIDNDFTLWINGTLITNQTSEGCAFEWNRTIPIPDSVWQTGENLVAFQARDRGGATGFETQLIEGSGSGQQQTKPLTLTMTVEKNNSQRAIALLPAGAYPNLGLAGLVGAFTDSTGQVIEPFAIGTPSKTLIVPAGATQVQLGIDDDRLSDNTGSGFLVKVNGASVTVPANTAPWRWINGGTNAAYEFGVLDGVNPVVAATGLTGGQAVTIAYQSGTVSAGSSYPLVNADGDTAVLTAGNNGVTGRLYPTAYMTQLTYAIGQSATFTAVVTDASGALVPNEPVTFNVAGANPQQAQASTDNTGTAHFMYHGFSAGTDVVQAQALIAGAEVISAQASVIWSQVTNQPPTVNAGPNQTINWPSDNVILNGTATDDGLPDGTLTATWTQVSGPSAAFVSTPNQLSTAVVFPQPGTYSFQLTVSDSLLSTASTVQITVAQPNQPPAISIVANSTSITLPANNITVTGTVTDDGLPAGSTVSSQWTQVSGPGSVSFSNPASPNTQIVFPAAGTYVVSLTASDTQLTSSVSLTVTVNPAAANQAPVVTVSASQPSITLPVNVIAVTGTVTDDGLPVGGHLSLQWSQLSGPLPATFSSQNTAATQVGFPAAGVYVLQLAASDTQLTGSASISITVNAAATAVNQPPTVAIIATQTALTLPLNTTTLTGVVNDDGLPNGTVSIQWAQISGPQAASLAQSGASGLTAAFPVAGVYGIKLTASDGQLSSSVSINITVTNPGGNQPPTVNAGPSQTIQLPQTAVTLNGYAADDGLPTGSTLSVNWSKLSGPAGVSFSNPTSAITQATFGAAGAYVLQLQASDTQLQSTSQVTVTVTAATQQPPPVPTISLNSPVSGSDVTQPVAIIGSVNMSGGTWTLAYSLDTTSTPTWTTFASGATSTSGTLATFDPTTLLNGTYNIQLTATDSFGQSASSTFSAEVDRNLKLSQFSITFNDLSVPLPGLPLQVTRTYDSRNKSVGDFGFGWTLGIKNVRLQKSRNLALNWSEDTEWSALLPQYCLSKLDTSFVTVTFPDGRVYKFQPTSNPQCQLAGPITVPTLGFTQLPTGSNTAGATLVPADGGSVLIDGAVPGPVDLTDYSGNLYNPTVFLLTTADGFTYTIDQTLGLTQVADLNGNTLVINANGVTSSTGKNVSFSRDGQNRITQIQDPAGSNLAYSYDASGNLSTFTDGSKNTTTFLYDNNHYLTSIKDPRGVQPIVNQYDASGRLTSTTDANGKTITYSPNLSTSTDQITDRLGNVTTYGYDGDGNITSMTDGVGNTTTYTYDANDDKLTETNALGKTTSYTYDALGNRLTETDPLGNTTTYTYNTRQQVLTVKDPTGHTTTNVYDTHGNLTSTSDANGKTTSTVYNANGTPSSVTDANNRTTKFEYDGSGNLTKQTDALNNVTTYTYDLNSNKSGQTVTRTVNGQPQSITTNYKYDGSNRLTETDYADGTKTQVQYNSIGKQSVTIDQLNRQTSYTYDSMGRLTTTTYPDTTTETATFDAENDRLTSTDRASHTTSYTYDADKRLAKTTYADNSFTQTNYDAAGRVSSTIDANNNTTSYGYDDAGRRTTLSDALSHVTTFAYDNSGNQISVKDARQNLTQYQYDTLNRQIAVIYPDQTVSTTAYDALGRVLSKADQAGKVTAYGYDALGRLTSVTQDAVTGGLNLLTQYGYDEVGNRISQTDANNHTTTYAYDSLGRRTGRTLPAGQSESYTYDSAGNLKTHIDFNGKTTTFAYDTSNRLLSKTPDASFHASAVTFTYFPNGLRQTMADVSGTTTYGYDTRNRLTSKQAPFGTLGYTYDASGNLLTLGSSNANGVSLTYTYDALNRLSTVTDNRLLAQGATSGVTTYNYDNVGNLQNFVYPNGVTQAYTYDALNRLTQMGSSANGTAVSNYAYTLGAAGNRTSVAELSGRTVAYGYDSLYRLTSETVSSDPHSNNGTGTYTYDAVGNRKTLNTTIPPAGGNTYTYDPDDRLASDQYDADGNTINSLGTANTYDFENHLITHGGVAIVYDGDGNRVSEMVGGVTTNYLVDTVNPTGYAQVVDELQSGAVTRTYSYGLERISETQPINSTWTASFYGYDGHGSVRQLTNSAGAVTDSYDYDAFGNLINQTGSTPNNYLFAGEQYDPALGMYFLRARYYNSTTGRFWSMDTDEGEEQDPISLHKYLYAGANPINRIDPSGHDSIAELDISSAISETLDTISGIQQYARVKNEFSTVLDVLSAITDLGILLAEQGDSGILNLAGKIQSAAIDRLGKEAVNLPLMLFQSIESNAVRIAQTNLLSPAKDAKLASAFSASDAAVLLYLPGVIGAIATFPTGLEVAGRPLELTSQGGMALLGMGFAGGGSTVQLFHLDLIVPIVAPGHEGPTSNDIDSWYDGMFLNYQVPR